ncbi:MAG: DNA translocase FtsK 4TM domain-containing protein, partial [Alphaproteobacteria bacterium]|nr:DNA translocase FtsK 4TM domain-containing protein [Alphaproteobacteria bacterium]
MANWTDSLVGKGSRLWQPAQSFLRRRVSEAAGLALFFAALLIAVALATYDRADPSWNSAADAVTRNWIGPYGADIADVLYQTAGAAALILPAVLFAWSFRFLLNRGLPALWLRLLLVPPAVLLGATALAVIPAVPWWSTGRLGFGGVFGAVLLDAVARLGLVPAPIAAMAAASLVGVLLLYILGLTRHDWRQIGAGAGRVAAASGRGSAVLAGHGARLAAWLRRRKSSARAAIPEPARGEPKLGARREPRLQEEGEAEAEAMPRRRLPPDLVAPKPAGAAPGKRGAGTRQATLDLDPEDEHVLPPLELLAEAPPSKGAAINEEALQQNARLLETVLEDFGVKGQIVKVRPGPVVTLYELEPAPGIKASRIIGLADDIARSMSAVSVRVAVVPGRSVMGIELPNAKAETVYLRELMDSE